ncbi:hypothetical protein [Saccharomonospora halophila]|uniref:hypothetical protein n=1 Tax=Saccharomonospora halophila TaxID=129922 RepID=UPI000367B77F|nr:hypothetical protein [Saccharomonospora halophila]
MGRASTASASGSAGVLPLLAGVLSAVTLTGAAVYTVAEAPCEPARYTEQDGAVTLVGGCVDAADLHKDDVVRDHDRPALPGLPPESYRP